MKRYCLTDYGVIADSEPLHITLRQVEPDFREGAASVGELVDPASPNVTVTKEN